MFSPAPNIAGGTCPRYFAPPVDAGMVGCGSQSESILQYHQCTTGPHRDCAKTEPALSFRSQKGFLGSASPWGRKVEGELSRQWGGGEAFPCTLRGHPQGEARAACVQSSWPGSQPPSASGAHRFLEASMPVMSRVEHEIPCLAYTISITSKTGKSGMVASTCHPEMWRQRSGSFSAMQ